MSLKRGRKFNHYTNTPNLRHTMGMDFSELLKMATGLAGSAYRGLRGDQYIGKSGSQGEQEIFRTKKGESYARDNYGNIVPMSPLAPTPMKPQVMGVSTAQAAEPTPAPIKKPIEELTFEDLLAGYGKYGATPSAQAVKLMAEAPKRYPVFAKHPKLLPAMSIVETGAGKYMTRPKGPNPQNLMNWGIYTDFAPTDQAQSVERAISGIGERMPYYQKFRDSGNLEDFVNTYAPASDGNEGYMQKLLAAMKYFE